MAVDLRTKKDYELMNYRINKNCCQYCGDSKTYISYESTYPSFSGLEKRCNTCHSLRN